MRSNAVVEAEVVVDCRFGFADGVVGMQVNFFIPDASSQPFHEHVVNPAPFAVHADLNAGRA